ncbi:MAG: plasmid stability protein [Cyanobacteria bacterium J06643_4]
MTNITLKSIEPRLAQRLRQRASEKGRTVEAEIEAILYSVLIPIKVEESVEEEELDLVTAIKQRFSPFGGLELPEMSRESIRKPPTF